MKIEEFQDSFKNKGIDLVLLIDLDSMHYNPNIFYFTSYKGVGAFIIPKNKRPFLMVPEMELERAKNSFCKAVSFGRNKLFDSIKKILRKYRIRPKTIGIDFTSTNVRTFKLVKREFKGIKIKDISRNLLEIRETKTEEDIKKIKKACSISDNILQKCLRNFKKFKTEAEVTSFLDHEARKKGCETSFPTIVASGRNASIPHYEPQNTKLKKGFCVIDFGIKYQGYCSDMTRTVYLGKPNAGEIRLYDFLLEIQNNLIKMAKKGQECSKLHWNCVEQLQKHSKYFIHGLGHGVGVEIHELPNLSLNSEDRIEKNMVFTIEPGIYIPNKLGIRIEDTILMKNKAIRLTKTPKELKIIN